MANKRYSERERLFKLIRGDEDTLKDIQRRKSLEIGSKKLKEFTFFVKQKLLETFCRLRKGEIPFSKPNLLSLNKVLIGILSVMVIYLVFDFVSAILPRNAIVSPAAYVEEKEASSAKLSPLGYYLDRIGGKDLFSPQRIALVKAKGEISSGSQPYAGLKLVGVDWGGNPVALIEDTQIKKTYFVKKGESVKDLKVMDIFRDRVTLRYDNKVVELK